MHPPSLPGRLYSESTNGITAVDTTSGDSTTGIFQLHMGCSEPAVVNGTVYTTSYDGRLHALRATDGSQIWVAPSINGSFLRCGHRKRHRLYQRQQLYGSERREF